MNSTILASAECYIAWDSVDAAHKDWQYYPRIDFWRDILPGNLNQQLSHVDSGHCAATSIKASDIFPHSRQMPLNTLDRKISLLYSPAARYPVLMLVAITPGDYWHNVIRQAISIPRI